MTIWNVRLRGPRGKQVMLQLDYNTTYKMFTELAAKELGFQVKDELIFRRGFPPRVVKVDDLVLVKNVFEANEMIVVDRDTGSSAVVLTNNSSAKRNSAEIPKRTPVKKIAVKVPRHGVHTLNPTTSSKKRELSKRKTITGNGKQTGRLVCNGGTVSGTTKTGDAGNDEDEPQRKYRRSRAINLTSKENVELSLVNAVSGRSNDRAAKFYRAATKNAVEHQYELTLATARLNATLGHNFETEELLTSRRADGSAAKMRVRFKETARKWKEEIVDLVRTDELQAVLKYVLLSGGETGREMLKPSNMAQVSTRVFWSIARMYDGDVAAGLADLVPDEDWSFLDTRTRVLSEKAIEAKANEEQYALWKQGCTQIGESSASKSMTEQATNTNSKTSAAKKKKKEELQVVEGSSDVEQKDAMSKCVQTSTLSENDATTSTQRDAAAQAALARLDRSLQTSVVVSAFLQETQPARQSTIKQAVSADDEKKKPVEETITVYCDFCKKARILSPEEAATAELDKNPWTCASLVKTGRGGECEALDDEVVQLTGVCIAEWLQKVAITTRQELADATVCSTLPALVNLLDPSAHVLRDKLEKLIDEARLDEVNDWMLELVGKADMVQQLEVQKLGTPADLIVTPSDLILEALSNTCSTTTSVSIAEVGSWRTRAQQLVEKHPWLAGTL